MSQDKNHQQKFEDRTGEITIDELKELGSFTNYSDEQAKQLLDTMKSFVRIVYNIMEKEESGTIFADKPLEISNSKHIKMAA